MITCRGVPSFALPHSSGARIADVARWKQDRANPRGAGAEGLALRHQVAATAVSLNVCDGVLRLSGDDDVKAVEVALDPTAYRFRRGHHRLRVQAIGAFEVPKWKRVGE